jgi:cell division protein FtsB
VKLSLTVYGSSVITKKSTATQALSGMRSTRSIWLKKILLSTLTLFGLLASGTVSAQSYEQMLQREYEKALLDSLIRYEYLKPTYYTLSKTHEYLNKEHLALRTENSLLQLQLDMQKQYYEKLLAVERKKRRWNTAKAFGLGFVAGKLTPPY